MSERPAKSINQAISELGNRTLIDYRIREAVAQEQDFSNRTKWLREELKQLRHLLAVVIDSAGGSVRISDHSRLARNANKEVGIESFRDDANRCTVLRVVR